MSNSMEIDNIKIETLAPFPSHVLEALTVIKKYLANQKECQEIKITQKEIFANESRIFVDYEACKLCKKQHGNLICSQCERKICSDCIVKKVKDVKCVRCKGAEKLQVKVNSEFDEIA